MLKLWGIDEIAELSPLPSLAKVASQVRHAFVWQTCGSALWRCSWFNDTRSALLLGASDGPACPRRLAALLQEQPSRAEQEQTRGNCWDNAVAESFFSSLKKERIKRRIYADRETAVLDVAEYIEGFYNPIRRHSHLSGVSPIEFEAAHRSRRSGVH